MTVADAFGRCADNAGVRRCNFAVLRCKYGARKPGENRVLVRHLSNVSDVPTRVYTGNDRPEIVASDRDDFISPAPASRDPTSWIGRGCIANTVCDARNQRTSVPGKSGDQVSPNRTKSGAVSV